MAVTLNRVKQVYDYLEEHGLENTIKEFNISRSTIERYERLLENYKNIEEGEDKKQKNNLKEKGETDITFSEVLSNKKETEISWREICDHGEKGQNLEGKANPSQDYVYIDMKNVKEPIVILNLCDLHFGSAGTSYKMLRKFTDEILSIPNLYVVLTGDVLEMAIKLRGAREVTEQMLSPNMQYAFLRSWLEEMKHKILWATWDNHVVEREDKYLGFSVYQDVVGRQNSIIYHDGIGYADLIVGSQEYNFVTSHKFQGRSIYNPVHGQQRYMKFEGQDREIAMSGDSHVPAFSWFFDGPTERVAINGGTLNLNSIYAKRYYSLFTMPYFPCIELYPDEHLFQPYPSIQRYLKVKGRR